MYRFHVPQMSCGGCLRAVTRAIRRLDPEAEVVADLETREIALRSEVPKADLLATLREAGYPASAVAEPQPAA